MTCATHVILAGAVGALSRSRSRAFLAGVGTHLIADLIPHRDFSPPVEAALAMAALGAVGRLTGFDSPAFAGALGGIAPDLEHGLAVAGIGRGSRFPSHQGTHGRPVREVCSQAAVALIALAVIAQASPQKRQARSVAGR
jgi:hypothetical protein